MPLQNPLGRLPQFAVDDKVVILSPGVDKGKQGTVVQVIRHLGDFVYRYEVLLADGTSKRYFSFEISSLVARSA
jgi:hypothetical protein